MSRSKDNNDVGLCQDCYNFEFVKDGNGCIVFKRCSYFSIGKNHFIPHRIAECSQHAPNSNPTLLTKEAWNLRLDNGELKVEDPMGNEVNWKKRKVGLK